MMVLRVNIDEVSSILTKAKASSEARIVNVSGAPYISGNSEYLVLASPSNFRLMLVAPAPATSPNTNR